MPDDPRGARVEAGPAMTGHEEPMRGERRIVLYVWRVERLEGNGICKIRGFYESQADAQWTANRLTQREGKRHTITHTPLSDALAMLNMRIGKETGAL